MITLIFSTFNGEQTLPLMFEALLSLKPPVEGWEIIAVNNNSDDNTESILQKYKQQLPLTLLFEKKKGKNHALNNALEHIQGDIIVFTDDDVLPQADWLVNISDTLKKNPSFSLFGGKITPFWKSSARLNPWNNSWINQGIVYAITADSTKTGEINPRSIWGPNMAIRREIFDKGFRFDTTIGPDGTNHYAMGSETSFIYSLNCEGYKCWFDNAWVVQHIIKESQMSKRWVLSRAKRFGRGEARKQLDKNITENCAYLWGAPRYLYRRLINLYLEMMIKLCSFESESTFKLKWEINYLIGYINEIKR